MCNLLTKYPEFITSKALNKGLKAYVNHKIFNSKFCDILPQIICDCFAITMCIVTPTNLICLTPRAPISTVVHQDRAATTAVVFYKKMHYDSIVPKEVKEVCNQTIKPTESAAISKNRPPSLAKKNIATPKKENSYSTPPRDVHPAPPQEATHEGCQETCNKPTESAASPPKFPPTPLTKSVPQEPHTDELASPQQKPSTKPRLDRLRAVALNVSGFLNKVEKGVLDIYLKDFDIICLSETNADELPESFSNSALGDYNCLSQKLDLATAATPDQELGGIHGLMIFAHPKLTLDSIDGMSCDSVLWATISNGHESIVIGSAYLPIQSRKYSDEVRTRIWQDLSSDLTIINAEGRRRIMLMGDMNAHTGLLDDEPKSYGNTDVADYLLGLDLIDGFARTNSGLTKRANSDTQSVNKNGKHLIELCHTFDLCILNGRAGSDNGVGDFTSFNIDLKTNSATGAGVVDYCLADVDAFGKVTEFYVDSFDPLLSDRHAPICVSFDLESESLAVIKTPAGFLAPDSVQCGPTHRFQEWTPAIAKRYKEELSAAVNPTHTRPNQAPPNQVSIDSATKSFTQTLLNAALVSKASKLVKKPSKKIESKPVYKMWFDRDCVERKQKYFRFKNQLRRTGCKSQSYSEARKFKQFLTKKRKEYHATLNHKLKILRSNNPREYWKILNSCTQGKKLDLQVSNDKFVEHFKSLAAEGLDITANVTDSSSKRNVPEEDNSILNSEITIAEALKEISLMKNGKTPGLDDVRNEYLKNLPLACVSTLVELFNTILDTGIIPTDWSLGVILPLFKKKGVATDPGNYRGITLLSCLSKLFTAILNRRLTKFIDKNLGNEQAGFRAKHSTMDYVFVLHHVIDFYRQQGRRLYCAFVDYSKAFDLVNRSALWHKLIQQGVGGKILTVIKNMYLEAKSCVRANGSLSDFFDILTGVRQGENLSPTLFAMFLNDFKDFLAQSCKGLEHLGTFMQDQDTFARLYVLLYADDTVLLAESADELQTSLTRLKEYCDLWGLKVNKDKTQIVIFSKGRVLKRPIFYLGEDTIEVVDDYTYLGVVLNYNGNYLKAMANQKKSANRAMKALLGKARLLELDIDTTLELFQRCVVPILLYGCEIWGYQTNNTYVLEVFYRKFIKIILKLSNSTPTCMVYGESGQPCIRRLINSRLMNFWAKLKFDDNPRLSKTLFKTVNTCQGGRMQAGGGENPPNSETSRFNFMWLDHVKRSLSELTYGTQTAEPILLK